MLNSIKQLSLLLNKDVLIVMAIFLVSIFCAASAAIIKSKLLILKVQSKITSLQLLVGLLDQQIIILDEQIKSNILGVNSKIVIAGVIFLGVIAILWFFFSGGGPGGSASFSMGDFFSAKSNVDISTKITNNSSTIEDIVVQTPLELLNISLKGTFDSMNILLLPNVSKWLMTLTEKNLDSNSINFNMGKSINSWLETFDQNISSLVEEKGLSTANLQELEQKIKSLDQALDKFILQTKYFLSSSNLNTLPKSHTDLAGELEFVSKAREVANGLLQKLVEHESLLNQTLPVNILVPDWFPGILGFFCLLSIIYSRQMINLHVYVSTLAKTLKDTPPLNANDAKYQRDLIGNLATLYVKLRSFNKTLESCPSNGPGEFLRINSENVNVFSEFSEMFSYNGPGEFSRVNLENADVFSKLLKALFELGHNTCLNTDFVHVILI